MHILYDIIIQPIVIVYDILFTIIYSMVETPVPTIIFLSIIINFLVLPLYQKADKIQKAEQEKTRKMNKWVKHIRKTFKGDERFMMLSNYYRIENYHPANVLKEAIPLLLQVPFFIAAYNFISSLSFLDGVSYGPINNLLAPDAYMNINGFTINVLPILMTIVNILSGLLYLRGATLSQKIQVYGTAIVFLILLYNSPSILVIYWLINNVFSLFKNLFSKYNKLSDIALSNIASISLLVILIVCVIGLTVDTDLDKLLTMGIVFFSILNIMKNVIIYFFQTNPDQGIKIKKSLNTFYESRDKKSIFVSLLCSNLCFTVLMGLYIPTTIISSSVSEFINKSTGKLYSDLIIYPFCIYIGLFMIWIIILICSKKIISQIISSILVWTFLGAAITNQFFFDPQVGILYTDLTFENPINNSRSTINILICIFVGLAFAFLHIKKQKIMNSFILIASLTLIIMSSINIKTLTKGTHISNHQTASAAMPIRLSKKGKNVVVMMLDRAIGEYVPYIFNEKPELKEKYTGFVNYPNTVSFGCKTNFGSPGLFGGYEYTPYEMDKRSNLSLREKHNEALLIMPILFSQNGYKTVVCDPPYANYQIPSDLSIYDSYPNIKAYSLEGKFTNEFGASLLGDVHERQKHNFIIYSAFRISPLFLKNYIYDNGRYLTIINNNTHFTHDFLNAYSVLHKLTDITEITDDATNNFLLFQNETPHQPAQLNPPDFVVNNDDLTPIDSYSNIELNGKTMKIANNWDWCHYCVNVATYKEIAAWLDYLKENDVYDNTRIILVADHGYWLEQFDYLIHPDGLDLENFRPLLMVKDFNSIDNWHEDNTFMTNADTPTLAMTEIIDTPINPFTGNKINSEKKLTEPLMITDSLNWDITFNNGNTFNYENANWWTVHDNIYDMNNWKKIPSE